MAPPLNLLIRALVAFEDVIIRQILRSPGFHRGVGRIQRFVDEKQNGPMPHEPLRQGEASANPEDRGFAHHFFQELKNQFRGTPTDPPPRGPPAPPKR
ncbi:hypothetical protein CGCSCA4_v003963 [Colletotrichum siamense]|uniref:Uncharacterized protein n=1 Tax=Colletotrichum siamense TaxID=690259 RepID=A0A9P5EYM3_COLSI|nr:uncharacterized protein CGCS363_v009306 [Colletotrichum siamense]XP_037175715.1 uncharacterized protein CGCA056_v010539 [Colletotrichum aenigma]KAI8269803.1 hypothetical protein K4K58_000252 [Colletotrichum sp. SAR11_239]KAI8301857.1 hypothetical protein K4K59_000851 [Colletotrichum sp. SAR11_240]KAF4850493.1 hypothetical protein CGCSCA4_v003963 [Colletotrichum siamense]KAF4862476.1 hypothetical protein CGCSCA2_v003709 [Colletotrichum siamense]KAF4868524.1 hypothetical protein CGCSCA1_v012